MTVGVDGLPAQGRDVQRGVSAPLERAEPRVGLAKSGAYLLQLRLGRGELLSDLRQAPAVREPYDERSLRVTVGALGALAGLALAGDALPATAEVLGTADALVVVGRVVHPLRDPRREGRVLLEHELRGEPACIGARAAKRPRSHALKRHAVVEPERVDPDRELLEARHVHEHEGGQAVEPDVCGHAPLLLALSEVHELRRIGELVCGYARRLGDSPAVLDHALRDVDGVGLVELELARQPLLGVRQLALAHGVREPRVLDGPLVLVEGGEKPLCLLGQ